MRLFVLPGAIETIREEATASRDGRETGGILLGHDPGGPDVLITVAGDPGPKAERRRGGFKRDLDYARRPGKEAYDRDGSVWIGEWHTHPCGPPFPSSTDLQVYRSLLGDTQLDFDQIISLILSAGEGSGWEVPVACAWKVARDHVEAAAIELSVT